MGLFVRRDQTGSHMPLYRTGSENTLLIVGLGNTGKKYASTRHNIGFTVLDAYRQSHDFGNWNTKKELFCDMATGIIGSTRVILAKPTTLMNNSGKAVQRLQQFYKLTNSEIVVVHDELDIDFLTLRSRKGGGSAGHNGIKSITQAVGEDYDRVRIGIGPKMPAEIDSADFVLAPFTTAERKKLPAVVKETCSLLDERTASTQLYEETRKVI